MSEDWQNRILSKNSGASVAKQSAAEVSQTSSRSDNALSIQSIVTGEGSEVKGIKMANKFYLADREFFFDIELRSKDGEELPQNIELELGSFYIARVSVSLNRFVDVPNNSDQYLLKQEGVRIDRQLNLLLESSTLTMHGERQKLELNCRRDWCCDFLIQVSDRCESEFATLQLRYQEDSSQNKLRFASSLDVKVPTSQRVSPIKNVTLTANIANANNAVILYVIPNGEKEWSIQGISPHEAIESMIKVPSQSMRLWNKNHIGAILKWLKEAIAYFRDRLNRELNLAIVDGTSQQISWEMVELQPNEFLGVKAKVVRWVEQEAWGEPILLDLDIQRIYQGRLVAYEHPLTLGCEDLHNRLSGWRDNLRTHTAKPVAIALLHCDKDLSDHLGRVRFDDLARCLQDRSLFLFVNSPYSARLIWEDDSLSGIAANALSEIASGYFGTLGKVDNKIAKAIEKKFIELAQKDVGINPALFLQALRSFYTSYLQGNDSQKSIAEQIFSYVYYGNPDDVVKITGGSQP